MLSVILGIDLDSAKYRLDLQLAVDAFLDESSFVCLSSLGQEKDVSRFEIRVLQCQDTLQQSGIVTRSSTK